MGARVVTALCSTRLLNPLVRLLATRNADPGIVPAALRDTAPDARAPVELVHGAIERAVEYFGDATLGLRLGQDLSVGEVGPLDYVLRSAPSARHALRAATRYSRVQSDGFRIVVEPWRDGGLLRLVDEGSWPRPVADMVMSNAYREHIGRRAPFVSRMECWLPYPAPRNRDVYEQCFPGAQLCFDAPFYAFAFDASYERAPQWTADPALYALLCARLDATLDELAQTHATKRRVRAALERQLSAGGDVSVEAIARALHMSRRTLSRKLGTERTTFSDELDAARRSLADAYVCGSDRPFAEVAFLLGFSHAESFHRAFKRWTGMTPLARRTAASRGAFGDAGTSD